MSKDVLSTEQDTVKTAAQVFERIRATQALSEAQRTIKLSEKSTPVEQRKRREYWINKWIPMQTAHLQTEAMQEALQQVKTMQEAVYEFCQGYGTMPSRGKRLVIWGENGAGKSRIAKKVANWADTCARALPHVESDSTGPEYGDGRRRPSCRFYHFPSLLAQMMQDFRRDMISELCKPPMAPNLLVLDDVGAEHDPSKYGASQLYFLLERRAFMWTLITTNIAPEKWEAKWERRVSSRLFRNAIHVAVDKVPDFSSIV